MVDYTVSFLSFDQFDFSGGINLTDATLGTLDVSELDPGTETQHFDGDLGDDENGWDPTQVLTGTNTQVYLEEGYVLEHSSGEQFTVYVVEVNEGSGSSPRIGIVFPADQDPMPAGSYTVAEGPFNVGTAETNPISPTYNSLAVPCFTRGTLIETDSGEVAIEDLQPGDLIRTIDNSFQPLRWVGSTKVAARGNLAPIRFAAGAFGNTRDLLVSPKHRMLMQGWRLEMLFDQKSALVTADALINDATITRVEGGMVEYFHIMFDQHQIVFAEGCPSESFYPATDGLDKLSEATREEVFRLFPQLREDLAAYGPAARGTLQPGEVALVTSQTAR